MLHCSITGVAQEMSFDQDVTVTYLVLRMSNGEIVRAAVDEPTAARVMALQEAAKGSLPPAAVRPPPAAAQIQQRAYAAPESDAPIIFGGDDAEAVAAAGIDADEGSPAIVEAPVPTPAPAVAAPVKKNMHVLPNGKVVVPSRTVPAGVKGWPEVPGMDTEELTSGPDQDEDGVASI